MGGGCTAGCLMGWWVESYVSCWGGWPCFWFRFTTVRTTGELLSNRVLVPFYNRTYCCTAMHAIVGWSVGGGWVVGWWWVHWAVPGGLADPFVRGLIFSCCRGWRYFALFFFSAIPAGNWHTSNTTSIYIPVTRFWEIQVNQPKFLF